VPAPAVTYAIGSPAAARRVTSALLASFHTRHDGRSLADRVYLDTFDSRLYREGGMLTADAADGAWVLTWYDLAGRRRHRSVQGGRPDFGRDLSEGRFRDELVRVVGIRRLLPVVRVEQSSERLSLLDHREKVVARLRLEGGTAVDESGKRRRVPARLRVERLIGYERAHAMLRHFLARKVGLARDDRDTLSVALAALGRTPVSYTARLDLRLDARQRADRATKCVLARLFEVMEANEDGLRRNLDAEFLHDFRVAVRRTRSCLGQLEGVLDAAVARHFADEFAWLGSETGPSRDLDIYLLSLDAYRAELPETAREHLAPLADYLQQKQDVARRRLTRGLESDRYLRLKRDWSVVVTADADEPGPHAARPIRALAAERIRRAYGRVRKRGRKLSDITPAETIHRLRIDCKKLRYLLEFFRSLFDDERVGTIIQGMKRLQDDLGDYNDLQVQQRELSGMADDMLRQGTAGAPTVLAMGRLVDRLESREQALRRRLATAVRGFVSESRADEVGECVR
jgi:CHAD domain-containing protein